jgi:AcrR family transcriptional regulator
MAKVAHKASAPREPTRRRVLDAALDLFGERGLTGVTVRDIAARAKVNVAAISYHFGGKEELYRAVAAMVVEGIAEKVLGRAPDFARNPPVNPRVALGALESLLTAIIDVIVGPPEMRRAARFIIREQMQPTAAFDVIFSTMSRLHILACRLFATATGLDPEAPATRLRVFLLLGQAAFLRIGETAILRRMEIERYDEAFLAQVKSLLRDNVRALVAAARAESL